MSIVFPSNPTDGQVFTASEPDNKKSYIYQSSKNRWRIRTDSDLLFVSTPTINSPSNGFQYASLTPSIVASDYYPNSNTPGQASAEWQISTSDSFQTETTTIYQTDNSSPSITSLTVPSGDLDYGTVYYARVRYTSQNATGLGTYTSNWSPTISFRTDVNPGSTWTKIDNGALSNILRFTNSNYRINPSLQKEIVIGAENLSSNKLYTYISTDNGETWTNQQLSFGSSTNYGGYIYKYIWNGYRWYIIYGKGYSTRGINYINGTDNNVGYYSLWTHNWTYTTTVADAVWNGLDFICASVMISGGTTLYLSRHPITAEGNFTSSPQNAFYLDGTGVSDPTIEDTGYPILCYLDDALEPSSSYTYRYHLAWTTSSYSIRYRTGLSDTKTEYNNVVVDRVTGAAYLKLNISGTDVWYFYIIRNNGKVNRFKLNSVGNFATFNAGEFPEGSQGQYYLNTVNHQVPTETIQHLNSIAVKQGVCAIIVGNNKTILKTNPNPIGQGLNNPGAWTTKYDTTLFADSNYNKVVYNAEYDVWAIVGTNGVILTSTDDGESWSVKSSGTTTPLRNILWSGDYFFAMGDTGTVLKS